MTNTYKVYSCIQQNTNHKPSLTELNILDTLVGTIKKMEHPFDVFINVFLHEGTWKVLFLNHRGILPTKSERKNNYENHYKSGEPVTLKQLNQELKDENQIMYHYTDTCKSNGKIE